ncbi:MAG: ArnT family glycosyltransferase [Candidatus Binatia bacterium]
MDDSSLDAPFGASILNAVALASAATLILVFGIASIWFPFGWDQGIHASVGDVIVRGGMPYRDAWDVKGPLGHYLFALAQFLFGRNTAAIRIVDLILLYSAAAMLRHATIRLTSSFVGTWVTIAYLLWVASLGWFHTAQPDGWVALFLILGAAPLLVQRNTVSVPRLAACGFLVGCCALVKPVYSIFIALPISCIWAARSVVQPRRMAIGAAASALAAAVPPAACAAWFAYRGALVELIEVQFVYNFSVYSRVPTLSLSRLVLEITEFLFRDRPAVALPAIVLGGFTIWRENRSAALLLSTWLAAALICVALQGKFWIYHWLPIYPPLVVLAGVGIQALLQARHSTSARGPQSGFEPGRTLALLTAVLFVGQLSILPARDVLRSLRMLTGSMTAEEYYQEHVEWKYVAGDEIKAARYLRAHTTEKDEVVVWGNDATINFLSGRTNPTPFVYAMPLTRDPPNELRSAYRRKFLTALRERPPAYVVVGLPHASSDKEAVLRAFPEFERFLRERYRLEMRFGFLDLYRLNP